MSSVDSEEDLFLRGKVFTTIEEVKKCVAEYNQRHFTNLVIRSNNKNAVCIECKHGRERKSECSGKRPKQHYNFLGCKASVRLYKSQKQGTQTMKVTQVNLEHTNHEINQEVHRYQNATLDEEDRDLVLTLKEANAKPSQIRRVLVQKKNKLFSTQRLKNLISKLFTNENANNESLEEFLAGMERAGGTVRWTYDSDDSVNSIFLCSAQMKQSFAASNPNVIQMDTTFNIEKGRYKLVAFCYLDSNSNKTEIAALALIASEAESNFNFVLSEFKNLGNRDDYIFLVDKDFNNIECMKRIFGNATILLCAFHVLKYMRTLVSTALTTVEVKYEIFQQFKSLVYCPSQTIFAERNRQFTAAIKDIEVRRDQKYVSLLQYYKKNWESCADMWVKWHRNSLPLLGDHTTNRIERQFWALKLSLSETFGTIPDTVAAIIHLVNFTNNRLSERRMFTATKSLVIYDADAAIHALNKEASLTLNERGCVIFHRALKKMEERKKSMSRHEDGGVQEIFKDDNVKVYGSSYTSCDCTFSKEHQAPCQHIMFLREDDDSVSTFDVSLFNPRYLKSKEIENDGLTDRDEIVMDANDNFEDFVQDQSETEYSLTDREKYKMIMPILVNIGNLVSCHSTNQFTRYLEQFKEIENLVRKGKDFFAENEVELTEEDNSPPLTSSENEEVPTPEAVNDTHVETSSSSYVTNEENSSPNAEPSTKYNLKFKQSLKSKGRPKKRTKQLTFNKTSYDRKKGKVTKKRRVNDVLRDMRGDDNVSEGTGIEMSAGDENFLCVTPNDSPNDPNDPNEGMFVWNEGNASKGNYINDEDRPFSYLNMVLN